MYALQAVVLDEGFLGRACGARQGGPTFGKGKLIAHKKQQIIDEIDNRQCYEGKVQGLQKLLCAYVHWLSRCSFCGPIH